MVIVIGDEGGKAIGEALKVNTSLTEIRLVVIKLVMKGERQSLKVTLPNCV